MRFGEGERTEGLVQEFAELITGVPTTVFCYLRRHDLYLASWYNQLVKMGGPAVNLSGAINRFLPGIHVDYARALRPWVEQFGRENVVVRRYEDRRGDVSVDVLRAVGYDVAFPEGTDVWENPRFPDVYVETFRRWNQLPMPADATAKLAQIMRRNAARDTMEHVSVDLLTPRARTILHERAVQVDRELGELLGLTEPFFPDVGEIVKPIPDSLKDFEANSEYGQEVIEEVFS